MFIVPRRLPALDHLSRLRLVAARLSVSTMPPKSATRTAQKRKIEETTTASMTAPKRIRTAKDPKDSHLYTDDNPETTLHGTGFKDKATALHTLDLVSLRSLTYQFQTINTMLYRAKGHPHKTPGIEEAISIFQEWVDEYKEKKAGLRSFPLLSKPRVRGYLERYDAGELGPIKELEEVKGIEDAQAFARMYVELGARKRLANTLLDNKKPGGQDWEVRRYQYLCQLVEEGKEWAIGELWIDERERIPTGKHLVLIFWAWSPSKKT